jgi:hypothetical protein
MKLLSNFAQELFHLLSVHFLQCAQGILVQLLLGPLVGGLHEIVEGDRILLSADPARTGQQQQ